MTVAPTLSDRPAPSAAAPLREDGVPRHDWTQAEIEALFDLPFILSCLYLCLEF